MVTFRRVCRHNLIQLLRLVKEANSRCRGEVVPKECRNQNALRKPIGPMKVQGPTFRRRNSPIADPGLICLILATLTF